MSALKLPVRDAARADGASSGLFAPARLPVLERAPTKWDWGGLGLLLAACLVCYSYTDLPLIVRHSLNLWDCLGRGELFHFYRTATLLPIGHATAQTGEVPYDIWVYLLLAVWNLPVYLWEQLSGLTFESCLPAMLWVRLAAVLPFAGANLALLCIAETLGRPRHQGLWACWLFSGSLFALLTPTLEFAGPTRFRYYQFWTEHLSIYVTLFYLMFVHKMRPTVRSAVKSYIALFIMVIIACCANAYLGKGANYLFMAELPALLSFVPSFFIFRIGIMAGVISLMYVLAYLPWYFMDKKAKKAVKTA